MNIAVDRRQHHLALGGALDLLEVLFQVRDGALHHLGALQHERQDELPRAEQVADLLHRRQQHRVEHVHRRLVLRPYVDRTGTLRFRPPRHRFVDIGLDALLLAMHDLPVDALIDRHPLGWVGFRVGRIGCGMLLEELDEARQGVLAAVEDQVLADRDLLGRDLGIGRDVRRVDDRRIQASLHRVVQKDRVEGSSRVRRDAEAQVRDTQRGEAAGDVLLHQANAFERLDRCPP